MRETRHGILETEFVNHHASCSKAAAMAESCLRRVTKARISRAGDIVGVSYLRHAIDSESIVCVVAMGQNGIHASSGCFYRWYSQRCLLPRLWEQRRRTRARTPETTLKNHGNMLHHRPRRFTMKDPAAEAVIDNYEAGRMPPP